MSRIGLLGLLFWVSDLGKAYFFLSSSVHLLFWFLKFCKTFPCPRIWGDMRKLGKTYFTNQVILLKSKSLNILLNYERLDELQSTFPKLYHIDFVFFGYFGSEKSFLGLY